MEWFKKAQVDYDRSYDSIDNMKVLKNTVWADVEAEWKDAQDFMERHYTQETGYMVGGVGGDVVLAGKIYILEETEPELYLKEVIEENPPMAVVKAVEDATSPISWEDIRPTVQAQVAKLNPIDVGLYDAEVIVSVSGEYRFHETDFEDYVPED